MLGRTLMVRKQIALVTILLIMVLSNCSKEKFLIVKQTVPEQNIVPVIDSSVDVQGKPLIVISPSDVLEILVRADGAPGMFLGEDGKVSGFYVDLDRMIMEEMGQSFHFVPYWDLGKIYQKLKSGEYHSALAVPDVPDYRAIFNLSIPYEILHYVTFVQRGYRIIEDSTAEEIIISLYGKKVGVQTQGHIYQALRDYKEIDLVEYETTTKALEALNSGFLDAVPDVKRIGEYYSEQRGWSIKSVGETILSHEITTSFSKALDPSIVDRYNTALKRIIENGRRQALWESYFGTMSAEYIP